MFYFNIGSSTSGITFSYYNCAIIIFCRRAVNQHNIVYLDGVGGYTSQSDLTAFFVISVNKNDKHTVDFNWKTNTNIQGIVLYN